MYPASRRSTCRLARLACPGYLVDISPAAIATGLALASGLAIAVEPAGSPPDDASVPQGRETVVTALRIPESLSDSLSSVRVISAEDLSHAGQMSLPDVLRQYAGVEVVSLGGPGQTSTVFIRGANSNHTLVLVDGLRIGSATAGLTAIENIPLSQIDRIEVAAGPLSALYGSDAIGGVIQIFTKGSSGLPSTSVSVGGGSFETARIQAQHAASIDQVDYSLAAGYDGSESFSATNPGIAFGQYNPDRDPYRNRNLSGRAVWHWDTDHALGISALSSISATHFDAGPGTDDVAREALSQFAVFSDDRLTEAWKSALKLGQSRDFYATVGAFPGYFSTVERQLGWQNTVSIPTGSLVAGVDLLRDDIDSDTPYTTTGRSDHALFAAYAGDLGAQALRASLRRENNSQFGAFTSGALAYGYRVCPQLKLHASYGVAFHAPTFNDLYYPGFSNPLLQPERSRNRELGADLELAGQRFAATAYQNNISNLIGYSAATFLPINVAEARIRGVEASWQARIAGTGLEARWTLQDPVDADTGLLLQRRASSFGSARAGRTVFDTDVALEWQASGARYDSPDQDPSTRLGGYGLLNLVLSRQLAPEWRASLRWNNVTAHAYALAQGYNTPTSNVFLDLIWTAR